MARYQNAMQTPLPAETYAPAINDYMTKEGFSLVDYKGQMVWKKGVGLATAPQYFSIQYQGNTIFFFSFIRFAILPGVYAGELGVDKGMLGAVPKALLRDRVATVERYIVSLWQPQNQAPNYAQG